MRLTRRRSRPTMVANRRHLLEQPIMRHIPQDEHILRYLSPSQATPSGTDKRTDPTRSDGIENRPGHGCWVRDGHGTEANVDGGRARGEEAG